MPLKLTTHNLSTDWSGLLEQYKDRLTGEAPPFESAHEDIADLRSQLASYDKYKNLLIIGNGGSVWSLQAYWHALGGSSDKLIVSLTDMEPAYLSQIKTKYDVADSLVIVISKSGSTVGVIEDIFAFAEYDKLFVTDPTGTIGQIGSYYTSLIIPHPNVGGRYTGFGSTAYVPAILAGLPVEEIEAGGRAGYEKYREISGDNVALQLALALYVQELAGFTEIFLPIYSNFLETFGMVVTQLFHESFGKAGQGMTVLAVQAPESQHHTNQRFFGGRQNMVGCFLHVSEKETAMKITVPAELQEVRLRTGKMADINGIDLADSYIAEYTGTITDAINKGIPVVDLAVEAVNGRTVGELMAFWHYVTVFSARLRQVDPFDQPQVEDSKMISFEERLKVNKG